jgi:hypothetical protein
MWLWRWWWYSDATARMPWLMVTLPVNLAAAYLVLQYVLSGLVGGVAGIALSASVAALLAAVVPAVSMARIDGYSKPAADLEPPIEVPW